jgi:Tol biopolymer transport system component
MPNVHLSPSTSRRDLAASLRGSRPRKHARLRHRRLQAERLEDRQLLATISGAVFNDLNANGLKDGGESGQSGWTIYLDADGNGQLSTTTDGNGSYSFDGLAPGSYTVAEVQQPGWQQTTPVGSVPDIERVSVANDGTQGNATFSQYATTVLSADGRYVAFDTVASNLVPADTNGFGDVFVYDRQTDKIQRVSLASDGTQGNGASSQASISADGRYVAFSSTASNLVPGDTNGVTDAFVYDRQTGSIECVSFGANGLGNDSSSTPKLSADGRYVAFVSRASNLVPGDTNAKIDVFLCDRDADLIERVSVASNGTEGDGNSSSASISADGHYVVFVSLATNLVPADTNGGVGTNEGRDIFVFDRDTGLLERVSVASDGTQGNHDSFDPALSADGRYVAFSSDADNLVLGDTNVMRDDFVYDRQAGTVERVSLASDGTQGNWGGGSPSISADGRYVAFSSLSNNLVPGSANGAASDMFVYDRQTDKIQLVTVASDGTQGNGACASYPPSISADGRYVAFMSFASNLISGDTNSFGDIFVTANPFAWESGSHAIVLTEGHDVSGRDFGNTSPTKFYVVNDATQNLTYEYNALGQLNESYNLNSGNTAPRGAASTIAGDKTWVVDANRKVYVYNNSGGLLGSWTAGTLATNATVEGIATNGTDVWIVDAKSDKVYRYAGAATRLSGSQNAASSFNLNSANTSPKDIVANNGTEGSFLDGAYLWVVNDSTTDKVFKYTTAGALVSSWTITTPGATSPTGITIYPSLASEVWIVDSGTDRVYQYNSVATVANGSSHAADVAFALAVGNTNPQGIADPPAPSSLLATETPVPSAEAALRGNDAALASMYYEPLKKVRIDTVQRSASRAVESHTRDLSYTVGASANRVTNDRVVNDKHHTEVDDLFAQWDSDPLELGR